MRSWTRADEWVQETDTATFEVADVMGHHGERVDLGRGGNEHIGLFPDDASHGEFAAQFASATGNGLGDRNYFVTLEITLHLNAKPHTGPPGEAEEKFLHADDGRMRSVDNSGHQRIHAASSFS